MKIGIRFSRPRMRRSLALADALREVSPGCEVLLITSGCPSIKGFSQSEIGVQPASWDMEATEGAIMEKLDILVLDNDSDGKFRKAMRGKAGLLVAFDDRSTAPDGADLLISPSLGAHMAALQGKEVLAGMEFCALPKEFDEFADAARENPDRCRRLAIHLGVDTEGRAVKIARILKGSKDHFLATICIPPDFPHGEALASEIGLDERFLVADDSPKRIASADLAVCSDSTLGEVVFFRVPFLLLRGDPSVCDGIARAEIGLPVSEGDPEHLLSSLGVLISGKKERGRMSARMRDLVDGLGRYRLADEITCAFQESL